MSDRRPERARFPLRRSAPPRRPNIRFPPELPISACITEIADAIERHPVVIVAGATGSGKTTQLPKIALEIGRGREQLIGVTEPRRIAATSVAARVASELECSLGNEIGYQIRFEDRTSANTSVKFMTDGILLAEIQGDRLLRRYDTIIVDEAHERSLTIDFILGWLKRILPKRTDLKVIVSSATIETARFSEFFQGAPVIQVEGRTFPVDVLYEPPDPELELPEAVANAVENVTSLDPRGDILVFLPGEREIHESEQALRGRKLSHTVVQPLYARLPSAEQQKIFGNVVGRRVILATNIAETSLTIPGIVYVIDTGIARLSRYDPSTGTTRLQIEAISQASADQRKGRCGRVRDGICVRLYDEQSFAARAGFTDPEIKRIGLAGVILRMKSLGLGAVEDFPLLDPPHARSIAEGYRVLEELGALGPDRELTQLGQRLARLPVDPRIGRMVLAGAERNCLASVLVLAAALEIQDPRDRPRGVEQKADERQRRFRDEHSDFVGLLRLWEFVREAQRRGSSELRRACKEHFLSFIRVREWMEVHRQLEEVVRELRIQDRSPKFSGQNARANEKDANADLHLALLSGLLSRIGHYQPEQRAYLGARQTRFTIHPSSALAKKPPAWLMAFELVQTTQLFARTVAKVEPEWLDQVGGHLMKRSYSEPHWSEKAGRASVKEHATLFGLPVLRDRSVDYSVISPVRARLMFIEHALVRGEYKSPGGFQQKNRELLAEVARLRDKARQSEMLADDGPLLTFFEQRIPNSVVNGKTFEDWREAAEAKSPGLLSLSLTDVLGEHAELSPDDYPDSLILQGVRVSLSYCFNPSADDDGITLTVPLALVPQLDPRELDWTIPAWHEEKIVALLHTLPKPLRRELGALPNLAKAVAPRLSPFQGAMLACLAAAITDITGVELNEASFRVDGITPYLRFTCRIVGEQGKLVAQGRDIGGLFREHGWLAREAVQRAPLSPEWQRTGLTRWDFGDLPPFVPSRVLGAQVRMYPAIVDRSKCVDLALLETAEAAEISTRAGIVRLILLTGGGNLTSISKRVPPPFKRAVNLPPTRTESVAFSELVVSRVVQEAFFLSKNAPLPRTKAAFQALLAAGMPRVPGALKAVTSRITAVSSELETTLRALDQASKQPSGTAAAQEIRGQLAELFPPDLLATTQLADLEQYPRYLRAAQTRLARAIVDPRKDQEKYAPLAPLWRAFLSKRASAKDPASLEALRWAFEELRVAIFAPELKPAVRVSVASVASAVSALR